MGCAAGVEHVETKTMWQIRPEHDALEQGELRDLGSSFDIWSWHHLQKGQPGPPNRQLHEKHLESLESFLIKVEKKPSTLQRSLMKKRNWCNDVSQENVKEVKEVNGVQEVEDSMVSSAIQATLERSSLAYSCVYMSMSYVPSGDLWNLHVLSLCAWAQHLTMATLGPSLCRFLKTESTKVARGHGFS